MYENRDLLKEIKSKGKPNFIFSDFKRKLQKGVVKRFKYKAQLINVKSIESVLDSMHDTLYELIRDNRENQAQKIRLVVIECFSKQEQIHNDKDLHDPVTGITH